ncbi:hypothetical protein Rhow_005034 [Rhodococcus wratislaviensis]|uniref:Uncharacterized protein n=1 Tax=Rhodococcus wratislaviensis TaxID=44752 RepID=A0A402CCM3_RHOWR|nr:hypothetical protein Rhow_005034 [Rhodococcus wratislaviensis]
MTDDGSPSGAPLSVPLPGGDDRCPMVLGAGLARWPNR